MALAGPSGPLPCDPRSSGPLGVLRSECPLDNYTTFLVKAGIFCSFLAFVFLAMFGIIWALEQRTGTPEPWMIALRQSREFCIWVCLSAQIMATASSSSAPGIPDYLTAIYTYLSFFNLDTGSTIHAECMTSLFTIHYLTLSGIIIMLLIHAALWGSYRLSEAAEIHARGKLWKGLHAVSSKAAGIQGVGGHLARGCVPFSPWHGPTAVSLVRLAYATLRASCVRTRARSLRDSIHHHVGHVSGRHQECSQAFRLQARLEVGAGANDATSSPIAVQQSAWCTGALDRFWPVRR